MMFVIFTVLAFSCELGRRNATRQSQRLDDSNMNNARAWAGNLIRGADVLKISRNLALVTAVVAIVACVVLAL
jgi:hypothetical protein